MEDELNSQVFDLGSDTENSLGDDEEVAQIMGSENFADVLTEKEQAVMGTMWIRNLVRLEVQKEFKRQKEAEKKAPKKQRNYNYSENNSASKKKKYSK